MLAQLFWHRVARSCCLIWLLVSGISALDGAALHLMIVADYDAFELLPALSYDVKYMRQEAHLIARHTGLELRETLLLGKKARTEQVWSSLNALRVSQEDLILFYFTGHGFRTKSKEAIPWPNLAFESENQAIDLSDIHQLLRTKQGRLTIILADCCNNVLEEDFIPIVRNYKSRNSSLQIQENYRKLFLNHRGVITLASCKAGGTSLALDQGSLYTLAFLMTLHAEVKKPSRTADWQTLLDAASLQASDWAAYDFESVQEPIFLIEP